MTGVKIPCPDCTDGFTSHGDRQARTAKDVCPTCAGTMVADARTGQTAATSAPPLLPSPTAGDGVREAMEALRPFAKAAEEWDPEQNAGDIFDDQECVASGETSVKVGHLRRARTALAALDRQAGEREGAVADIAAERRRQVEAEGFTFQHDDRHDDFQMIEAAICYAMKVGMTDMAKMLPPKRWPWDREWWKPTSDRRMLIKAGALIVAEIERLDRATASLPAAPRDADRVAGQGERA